MRIRELEVELEATRGELASARASGDGVADEVVAAVTILPMVLWAMDSTGLITLSEGRGLVTLGLKPGELVGQNVFEVYAGMPLLTDPIQASLSGDFGYNFTRHAGGWWESRYFPRYSKGEVIGLYGISMDVTTQRQAEVETLKAQAMWQALAEAAPAFIMMFDREHRITYLNRITILPSIEDAYGRSVYDFIDEAYHTSTRVNLDATFRGELGRQFDTARTNPDGTKVWMENRLAPLIGEAGEVEFIMNVSTDVTDKREAELEHARLQEQLFHAQKLDSLGVLTGGIAHDFNNLLVGVMGHCDLASLALGDEAAVERHLKEIGGAASRAADLCQQMLSYAGKGSLRLQPTNLTALVDEISDLLTVSLETGVRLEKELSPQLCLVDADGAQLQQVIMNLITNASDAMAGRSGVVTVRTHIKALGEAELTVFDVMHELTAGEYVCLEVSDTGVGMSEETQLRMFDPFFTTKVTGRGLGMASVLGIVKRHQGALSVQSVLGAGTTIRMFLPKSARTGVSDSVIPKPSSQPKLGEGKTVLVVDDEPTVNQVARALLGALGFETLGATDGAEAVEIYRSHPNIDLVVMDLMMPVMNGIDAAEKICGFDKDAKILLSSGYSEDEETLPDNITGLLRKPYRLSALQSALRAALN